jgi:DeoR/GlpR family transcriptional regulator of sugar metabolism
MNTKHRRDKILAAAYDHGHVDVKTLAQSMEVSEATVRRDLRQLAEEKLLELVYGGATLPRTNDFSFRAKSMRNIAAKRIIGRLAAQLVGDNDQIFIDAGTTTFEMAPYLRPRRGLSVVVNSARLAAELGNVPEIDVIVLGGQYRGERGDMIGPLAISTLEQLRGYQAFVGADGLSTDFGVTASDIDSAHLYRLAIRHARQAVLMVDHTKLMAPSLYKIAEFDTIDTVVTDQCPSEEWMTFFGDQGIDVVYPEAEGDNGGGGGLNRTGTNDPRNRNVGDGGGRV